MANWKKLSQENIKHRVFEALKHNKSFFETAILGVPASHLDSQVFNKNNSFLADAPYLSTLIQNPNHIGCHTLKESEAFFSGTQELERELIRICAEDIFKADEDAIDGYVASGGTEANMQAMWMYRNYFMKEYGATADEVIILCSQDSHYSFVKAANVLQLDIEMIPVNTATREIDPVAMREVIGAARKKGRKYAIGIVNMMTTMFGSVDKVEQYTAAFRAVDMPFRLHVDGAYGGFFYPFSDPANPLTFEHPDISSIALDAHKMLQAPYGTGIFLARKGLLNYTLTQNAKYVKGLDVTLVGSRSGANAIAVWMILQNYGPYAWYEKIQTLLMRTVWLEQALQKMEVAYYRHPFSNIVTIAADEIPAELAEAYSLVPDDHHEPAWYKIVVMEHVTIEKLKPFVEQFQQYKTQVV